MIYLLGFVLFVYALGSLFWVSYSYFYQKKIISTILWFFLWPILLIIDVGKIVAEWATKEDDK